MNQNEIKHIVYPYFDSFNLILQSLYLNIDWFVNDTHFNNNWSKVVISFVKKRLGYILHYTI